MPQFNKTRKKSKIPIKPYIPSTRKTTKPGNDFYMYVNGNWLRHVNMPPYLTSYGISEEIEDQINTELQSILQKSRQIVRSNPDSKIPHTTYLIGTLTESVLNVGSQDLNVKTVQGLVSGLQCIRDIFDIGSTIGDFLKHRIPTVLTMFVAPQETDSTYLRLILAPGSLNLPDASYYFDNSLEKVRILRAYEKLLKQLGSDFNIEGLEEIIGIEQIVVKAYMKSKLDDEILIKGKEIRKEYPNIPWKSILLNSIEWSESEFDSHNILVISKTYLHQLNKWCTLFPIQSWKRLLSSQILMYMLPLLPPPYDDMDFELFGHRMRGQSEKTPQQRLALKLAEQWLSASLGSEFINEYVDTNIKEQASLLAREIKESAKKVASSTEWLQPETRTQAGKKVDSIYLGVAYPTTIQKDTKTTLHPEYMIKNILTLSELDFKDEMKLINTILKPEKWDDDVFAVNAYYYNEGNRLILPAGILRWPFFHPNASDGWNFGGLGATIGHEISHAFDSDGKEYDENGNRNSWWNKEEIKEYSKKTKQIIELYNKTKYFGHSINGILTLSENIADLGGLTISLQALKTRLKKKSASSDEVKRQICDFFTSYAVSWRTKEKKQKAYQGLFMDVHAPPPARVNNVVCQFDEWYECFDVKPGDLLYKDPNQRLRIF